jgi:hypothetical protein
MPRVRAIHLCPVIAALHTAGCSGEEPLRLELPISTDHRAGIIAIEHRSTLEVQAIDLTSSALEGIVIDYDDSIPPRIFALLYRETLNELGLGAGLLLPAQPGQHSEALPQPDDLFESEVREGIASVWERVLELNQTLMAFRRAADSPCADFEVSTLTLTSTGGGSFACALSAREALVGTDSGGVAVVDVDGRVTELEVRPLRPIAGVAAFSNRTPSNRILVGGDRGQLMIGTVTGNVLELEEIAVSPLGEHFSTLEGFENGTVFTLSHHGVFERYTNGQWTELFNFDTEKSSGALSIVSSDEAVAVWPNETFVARVRGDQPKALPEETGSSLGIRSAVFVPGFGSVIGTVEDGGIFSDEGTGVWHPLPGSLLSVNIQSIAPYRAGFVYGGTSGHFGQYVPGYGHCAMERPAGSNIEYIVPLGDDLLLLQDGDQTTGTSIAILRPR